MTAGERRNAFESNADYAGFAQVLVLRAAYQNAAHKFSRSQRQAILNAIYLHEVLGIKIGKRYLRKY